MNKVQRRDTLLSCNVGIATSICISVGICIIVGISVSISVSVSVCSTRLTIAATPSLLALGAKVLASVATSGPSTFARFLVISSRVGALTLRMVRVL